MRAFRFVGIHILVFVNVFDLQAAKVFKDTPGFVWVQPGHTGTLLWQFYSDISDVDIYVDEREPGQTKPRRFLSWLANEPLPTVLNTTWISRDFVRNVTALSFSLYNVLPEDTGTEFRLKILVDGHFQLSNATIVSDVAPGKPTISQDPDVLEEGGVVSLICSAESNIPPRYRFGLVYQWQRAGVDLNSNTSDHTFLGPDGSQVIVTGLHAGTVEYKCHVKETKSAVSVSSSIVLNVEPDKNKGTVYPTSSNPMKPQISTGAVSSASTFGSVNTAVSASAIDGTSEVITKTNVGLYVVIAVMALVILVFVITMIIFSRKRCHKQGAVKMRHTEILPNPSAITLGYLDQGPPEGGMSDLVPAEGLILENEPESNEARNTYCRPDSLYSTIKDPETRDLPPLPDLGNDGYLDARKLSTPTRQDIQGLVYSSSNFGSNANMTNSSSAGSNMNSTMLRSQSSGIPNLDNRDYLTTSVVASETVVKEMEPCKPELQNQYSSEPLKADTGYLKLNM